MREISGRDALLGLFLAVVVAALIFALIYVSLLAQSASGGSRIPGGTGPVAYALLHGGAASVEVPPIPALFGIGGDLRVGFPVLSFVLLPFLAFLVGGRMLARRAGSTLVLSAVAALSYGVFVGVVSLLSSISIDAGNGTMVNVSASSVSAALWAALWATLGTGLGAATARGPWLPVWARQAIRGAVWALGTSLLVALLLSAVVGIAQQTGEAGTEAPAQQAPGDIVPPEIPGSPLPGGEGNIPSGAGSGGGDGAAILASIGAIFALLPVALGNLLLLAHGVPIGLQNAPDLSQIPLLGSQLANGIPLQVSLFGNWPLGAGWRVLLVAPVVGLLVGGLVSARSATGPERWWRGALVTVPYTIVAFVVAIAVGVSLNVALAGAEISVALRASLLWLLLLLPAGAVIGALGGLLSKGAAGDARPRWTFWTAAGTSTVLLAGTLPLLAAPLALSGAQDPTLGQGSGSLPNTVESTQFEETSPEGGSANSEIALSETSQGDSPAEAFDELLPILDDRTQAPIMLPAVLPQELENVAVDEELEGEEYGILFLYEPTGNAVETFVGANTVGTLTVSPETEADQSNEFFEATRTEEIELPDGTLATLRYLEPTSPGGNQGPYWEGEFQREGYTYTLTVLLPDPSGDIIGRTLSSMVLARDAEEPVGSQAELEQAVGDYYRAAGSEDWAYTYEYLDSETKSMFTEEEWYRKNQYFADLDQTIYHVVSTELDENSEEPTAEVRLRLTGEEGSSQIRTTHFVWEDGAWRHRFAQEEIELFRPELTYEEFVANR